MLKRLFGKKSEMPEKDFANELAVNVKQELNSRLLSEVTTFNSGMTHSLHEIAQMNNLRRIEVPPFEYTMPSSDGLTVQDVWSDYVAREQKYAEAVIEWLESQNIRLAVLKMDKIDY